MCLTNECAVFRCGDALGKHPLSVFKGEGQVRHRQGAEDFARGLRPPPQIHYPHGTHSRLGSLRTGGGQRSKDV